MSSLLIVLAILAILLLFRRGVGAVTRRALGGYRFARRAAELNRRLAAVISQLETELRARDAEIERLRAQLRSEQSPSA